MHSDALFVSAALAAEPPSPTFRGLLMQLAKRPDSLTSIALAGVIGRSWQVRGLDEQPLYGLDAPATRRLLARHFPGAEWLPSPKPAIPAAFDDAIEMDDVLAMLVEHLPAGSGEDGVWLAHAVATGCLGDDHLWQDMQLPSRSHLSALMNTFFASLAARNTQDMKWKKFLYKQLCDRAAIRVCRAPSCGVCSDYAKCFGPEE
jgi:nitrogen fixation protein NifQ